MALRMASPINLQSAARFCGAGSKSLRACSRVQTAVRSVRYVVRAHKVEVEHQGKKVVLEVPEDETILSAALDAGMDLPYDCKLGVCMTCPAKLVSGEVDQTEGMLSDDVQAAGYALMCAAYPKSDVQIRVIPEEELLSLQLVTSQ